MDRSDVIKLIAEEKYQDEFGIWRSRESERQIFCSVESVTRAEFFEGGRNGLNPELMFTVFFDDYQGESTLIYKGKAYSIYRTFRGKTDTLELYAQRKGGTNGKGG